MTNFAAMGACRMKLSKLTSELDFYDKPKARALPGQSVSSKT
jgi:hypothetical protein